MKILDRIRVINMYILIFSLLFVLQKYTIGLIPQIKNVTLFNGLYFYEIFFAFNSVLFILLCVKVGKPRRN